MNPSDMASALAAALEEISAAAPERFVVPVDVTGPDATARIDHRIKGCNFFDKTEHALLCALQAPRFSIAGVRRADLKPLLPQLSAALRAKWPRTAVS